MATLQNSATTLATLEGKLVIPALGNPKQRSVTVHEIQGKIQVVLMANAGQPQATCPLFFPKTGCPNEVTVVSGNQATTNFKHCSQA